MNGSYPSGDVAELFADLLEVPEAGRRAVLEQRTRGRPDLRAAVVELLEAHEAAAGNFLSGIAPGLLAGLASEAEGPPGGTNPYRLVREVGRGGMGSVYLGERADGLFDQRVAVKMLKRGMDSEAILARFLRERRILASLEHPNIARLLDGGVADDGRPYIVMEFVEGTHLLEYADPDAADIDDRIRLFAKVCDAVAYAHRNLVVHRDLKPSNILVTAGGEPKLLDFGIAKILGDAANAPEAGNTELWGRPLTPAYAAPEQSMGLPVTTSTDVYGLGVVLHEFLTGRRPDGGAGTVTPAPDAASPGARDRVPLPRDVETILTKALRPEPEERYVSADALGDDLRRYLARMPIRARPPTWSYRASRFLGRHPVAVAAAAVAALLISGFSVVSATQAVRIQRQAAALELERDRARTEAARAQQVADFMVRVFQVSDPARQGSGDSISARELLDRGAERITADLNAAPAVRAGLLGVMAQAYGNLGRYREAETLARQAVEIRREVPHGSRRELADSWRLLGSLRRKAADLEGSAEAFRQALALLEPATEEATSLFAVRGELSAVLHMGGDHEGARALTDSLLNQLPVFGPGELAELPRDAVEDLAAAFAYAGRYTEAARLQQALSSDLEERDEEQIARTMTLWREARTNAAGGRLREADSLYRAARWIRQRLSPLDPTTAELLVDHAVVLKNTGQLEAADSTVRTALVIHGATVGPGHSRMADGLMVLAGLDIERGDHQQAADNFSRAATIYRNVESGAPALLPVSLWRGGGALWRAGRADEGIERIREAVGIFSSVHGDAYLMTLNARRDLGYILVDAGRADEAVPVARAALAPALDRWGEGSVEFEGIRVTLARGLAADGRPGEAEDILTQVIANLERAPKANEDVLNSARGALEELRGSNAMGLAPAGRPRD